MGVRLNTPAEYARHRGVTRQAVNQAIREGRIRKTRSGLINVAAADLAWAGNTHPTHGGKRSRTRAKTSPARPVSRVKPRAEESATPPGEPPSADVPAEASGTQLLVDAKLEREGWNAKLAKMDYHKRRGELLDRADVCKVIFEIAMAVRDRVYGVVPRVAGVLMPGGQELLMRELDLAMADLARLPAEEKASA